ncbi:hypothetical protein [Marinivivus vitaminiproducens]|uniref:hypothetical protein n=1 Tax=Marinivivus vitaminiproducens TaxID=3035935 RepID=UPI002799EB97|nr:hypothetical protein P4R82_24830 [Geminicoccaceae bacterium SCSIO 64248]
MRSTILLAATISATLMSPAFAQSAPDYAESLEKHVGRAAASEIRRATRELIPRTGITAVDRVARGVAGDYSRAASDAVRTDRRDRPTVEERRAERELRRAQREQRAAERERRREDRRQERAGEFGS